MENEFVESPQHHRLESAIELMSDAPEGVDLVWDGFYQRAIANFFQAKATQAPFVMGIEAPWGQGKSNLMKGICRELQPEAMPSISNNLEEDPESLIKANTIKQLKGKYATLPSWRRIYQQASKAITIRGGVSAHLDSMKEKLFRHLPKLELFLQDISLSQWWTDLILGKADEGDEASPADAADKEDDRKDFETFFFSGWIYSDESQKFWVALAQDTIRGITDRWAAPEREDFYLALNAYRIDVDNIHAAFWGKARTRITPSALLALAIGGLTVYSSYLNEIAAWTGGTIALIIILLNALKSFRDLANETPEMKYSDFLQEPKYDQVRGIQYHVERDFRFFVNYLKDEKGKDLIIFIDDLDRCTPGKITEVIEALNIFIGDGTIKCFFVLGLDTEKVAKNLGINYQQLAQELTGDPEQFGRQFLQKFIQVTFHLPQPGPEGSAKLANALTQKSKFFSMRSDIEQAEEVVKLAKAQSNGGKVGELVDQIAKERGLSEDASRVAQQTAIAESMNEQNPEYRAVIEEAAAFLPTNPRRIKMFLNRFRLAALIHARTLPTSENLQNELSEIASGVLMSILFPREFALLANDKDNFSHVRSTFAPDRINSRGEMNFLSIFGFEPNKMFKDFMKERDHWSNYSALCGIAPVENQESTTA